MEAPGVLREPTPPRERRRQEKRVEPRVVEPLAEERPGGDERAPLPRRHGGDLGGRGGELLRAEAADELEDVRDAALAQRGGERGDVVAAVGEDDGRAPFGDGRRGVREEE